MPRPCLTLPPLKWYFLCEFCIAKCTFQIICNTINIKLTCWYTSRSSTLVTIPAEIGDTERLSPKFIVPAVPTVEPLSFTTTPEPEPITPVNPEPSPTKLVALIIPVILTLPVPVIDLLNKSKFPPSWGVVSSTTLEMNHHLLLHHHQRQCYMKLIQLYLLQNIQLLIQQCYHLLL